MSVVQGKGGVRIGVGVRKRKPYLLPLTYFCSQLQHHFGCEDRDRRFQLLILILSCGYKSKKLITIHLTHLFPLALILRSGSNLLSSPTYHMNFYHMNFKILWQVTETASDELAFHVALLQGMEYANYACYVIAVLLFPVN